VKKTLLVDLNTILDIRFAALAMYSEQAAEYVIMNGYRDRISDKISVLMPGFDDIGFEKFYNTVGKEVLLYARPTEFLNSLLSNKLKALVLSDLTNPGTFKPQLIINIGRFNLTAEEAKALIESVRVWVGNFENVSVVKLSSSECTPQYLKDNADLFVTYDFDHWLKLQQGNLTNNPIPANTILTGARFWDKFPTKEDLWDAKSAAYIEVFSRLTLSLVAYVGVEFIDLRAFSIIDSKTLVD